METKKSVATQRKKQNKKVEKQDNTTEQKPKSKTTLFWEKYPNGTGSEIINMRAVLR
jgi:hypothetical protein